MAGIETWERAIRLIDRIERMGVALKDKMVVLSHYHRKSAARLTAGTADDKDLDEVEKMLNEYEKMKHEEGAVVQPRNNAVAKHYEKRRAESYRNSKTRRF